MYHLKRAAQKTLKKEKQKVKSFWIVKQNFSISLMSSCFFLHTTTSITFHVQKEGKSLWVELGLKCVALSPFVQLHWDTVPMTAGFLCQVVCFQTWSDDLAYFRRTELLTLYWASCEAGSKALWCLCVILRIAKGLETQTVWYHCHLVWGHCPTSKGKKTKHKWTSGWPGEWAQVKHELMPCTVKGYIWTQTMIYYCSRRLQLFVVCIEDVNHRWKHLSLF